VEEDSIMPLTYALPHEFNSFVSGYQSISRLANAANTWIIKPIGLSRGRGISLVDDIADVSYSQPIVIQRYVADPLCFMGFKFDLRVYVLVTSFSPLEAFIYKEGLGRFGSRQYSLRSESLNDHRIHLTNSSIQREFGGDIDRSHPAYQAGSNGSGNKVSMQWLFGRLEGLGVNAEALWQQIVVVCRKALIASGSEIPHQPNSFEIFGFDIMFDSNLKCWLLEVNSSPSLGCDSPLDTRIKGGLIRDSIALVDPLAYDRKVLADVCKRRLTRRKSASDCSRNVLERDLSDILKGKPPRPFGKVPRRLGLFRQIV
jgi:tubulin polyglutamylase TTLL5